VGSGVFSLRFGAGAFLALYTSINSFSELVVTTRQREGFSRDGRPRAGEKIVV